MVCGRCSRSFPPTSSRPGLRDGGGVHRPPAAGSSDSCRASSASRTNWAGGCAPPGRRPPRLVPAAGADRLTFIRRLLMFTRRQTLALSGAGAALGVARHRFALDDTKTFRIGFQKGGVLSLAKQQGAIEKRLAGARHRRHLERVYLGPAAARGARRRCAGFRFDRRCAAMFAQAAGGDLLYVAAHQGCGRRLGDPGQEGQPDPDAGRPQGQETSPISAARRRTISSSRRSRRAGSRRRRQLVRPCAARRGGGVRRRADRCVGHLGSVLCRAGAGPGHARPGHHRGHRRVYGYYLANGSFAKGNPHVITDVLDELQKTGAAAQANLDETAGRSRR